MTKVADGEARKNERDGKKNAPDRTGVLDRPELTAAEKILQNAGGWAGSDLEDVIQVVSATRSRSRF